MRSSLPQSWIPLRDAAEPTLQEASAQWVRNVDLPAGLRQVLLERTVKASATKLLPLIMAAE